MQQRTKTIWQQVIGLQRYACIILFAIWTLPAFSQATNDSSFLFSLSLQPFEIKQQKVSTASRVAEDIFDAPSVVTVLDSAQIEAYGATSLIELLDRMAGVYTLGTVLLPENIIAIRGDNTVHFNTRVLFLLNGRPIREHLQGGTHLAINRMFPISRIARIELIRGPGSVLYGTGAYTGVINIITKSHTNGVQASVTYGSFQRLQGEIHGGVSWGNWRLNAGANLVNDEGWEFTASDETTPVLPESGVQRTSQNTRTILMNTKGMGGEFSLRNRGFHFNTYYGRSQQNSMYFTQWLPISIVQEQDTTRAFLDYYSKHEWLFTDVGYTHQLRDFWRVSLNATYNRSFLQESNAIANDDIARGTAESYLLEMVNFFELNNERGTILVGGTVQRLTGEQISPERTNSPRGHQPYDIFNLNLSANPAPLPIIPAYQDMQYAVYAQWQYRISPSFHFIGGLQANKVVNEPWDLVPRFSVLFRHGPLFGMKFLYGEAFRSATYNEQYIEFPPIIQGNAMLTPERIRTAEWQGNFKSLSNRINMNLTFFYSRQTDVILRFPQVSGVDTYVNSGERKSYGFEFENRYRLRKYWHAELSVSYQSNSDVLPSFLDSSKEGGGFMERNNFTGMPNWMTKFGIRYQNPKGIQFSLFHTHYSAAKLPSRPQSLEVSTPMKVNPSANAVLLGSAQCTVHPFQLFGNSDERRFAIRLYATNLWNSKAMMPEYTRRVINALPARSGRAVYGSVIFSF